MVPHIKYDHTNLMTVDRVPRELDDTGTPGGNLLGTRKLVFAPVQA